MKKAPEFLIVTGSVMSASLRRALTGESLFLVATESGQDEAEIKRNDSMQQTADSAHAPIERARTAMITQLAVCDAVNCIIGEWEPYLEKVAVPAGASADAAAISAAHHVLATLHPERQPQLDASRAASLAVFGEAGKQAGIAVGKAAADAILT